MDRIEITDTDEKRKGVNHKREFEELIKDFESNARRPMHEAGVYDPMEQAGHSDMISLNYVIKKLKEVFGESEK